MTSDPRFTIFLELSYYFSPPSFNFGISAPLLSVISPAFAYVSSFSRVSEISRFRIVNCPIRSRGENVDSPFSIVSRSGLNVRFGDSVFRIE
jgi:hypothetical protein